MAERWRRLPEEQQVLELLNAESVDLGSVALVGGAGDSPIAPIEGPPVPCEITSEVPEVVTLQCTSTHGACVEDAECGSVYRGVNCTSATGDECTSGSANCTCESFQFDYCEEI